MNGRRNATPKIEPVTLPTAGLTPVNIPQPPRPQTPDSISQNDWRARLRARVAAIEKTVPADIRFQL